MNISAKPDAMYPGKAFSKTSATRGKCTDTVVYVTGTPRAFRSDTNNCSKPVITAKASTFLCIAHSK